MSIKARPLLAVGQMNSSVDIEDNFKVCSELTSRAAERKAAMLCLPECFAFMGASAGASVKMAEPLDGPLLSRYAKLAKDNAIWLSLGGFQEKVKGDKADTHVYNSHVIFNDEGKLVATYRKIHLFDVEVPGGQTFKESNFTVGGEEVVTVDSPVGKLGLSICYDLRFPELYAALARASAQVMLVPAAFTLKTGLAHWHVLLRARAIETQCYVVAAAQSGQHNASLQLETKGALRESYGHACIIDPWGAIVAECSEGTGLAFAEIDLDKISQVRKSIPLAQHHRYELFAEKSTL